MDELSLVKLFSNWFQPYWTRKMVQVMAWCRTGNKTLPEPMLTRAVGEMRRRNNVTLPKLFLRSIGFVDIPPGLTSNLGVVMSRIGCHLAVCLARAAGNSLDRLYDSSLFEEALWFSNARKANETSIILMGHIVYIWYTIGRYIDISEMELKSDQNVVILKVIYSNSLCKMSRHGCSQK